MPADGPVAAALGNSPLLAGSVSDEERARLHAILDELLDSRLGWECVNRVSSNPSVLGGLLGLSVPDHLSEKVAGHDAREILGKGAAFLRDVLGTSLRSAALRRPIKAEDGGKTVLKDWLNLL